jgi:antitoxin component of MazEF toxin-antitoxin module
MAKLRKVIKTGNSLAITVPSGLIKDFGVKEGDPVIVRVNKSKSSITFVFSGHPRQLSLIDKTGTKD